MDLDALIDRHSQAAINAERQRAAEARMAVSVRLIAEAYRPTKLPRPWLTGPGLMPGFSASPLIHRECDSCCRPYSTTNPAETECSPKCAADIRGIDHPDY